MPDEGITLCEQDGCRQLRGHQGPHQTLPKSAWSFLLEIDQNKIAKAGYATPRGGKKGAYQNHVYRNNRVIIPFEHLDSTDVTAFKDGYIVRLFPHQCFSQAGVIKPELNQRDPPILVGNNAFVLYRTHESLQQFPPPNTWQVRSLQRDGEFTDRRGHGVLDIGHYVLRISRHGQNQKQEDGAPQGIFAPEYADVETNFLCQCVLAWLIVSCADSPYTTAQAAHIRLILENASHFDVDEWERKGVTKHGITTCPLCSRSLKYRSLHEMLALEEEDALANAGLQVEGATRSTVVNLFHLDPMTYGSFGHQPLAVAWGHAICNTKLGQRKCFALSELQNAGYKLGIIGDDRIETFAWMSQNWEMIRSPAGAVWVRLCADHDDASDEVLEHPHKATAEDLLTGG